MTEGFHGFVMFYLSLSRIGWILFSNAKETLQKMLNRNRSYRAKHINDWKKAFIKSLKLPNFFFDIRVGMYWQNAFVEILSKTGLVGKDLKNQGKIIQVWLAIRNQKHFKPIANGHVADSGMIALTDEPLPCRKPKKEWKFKCKSWMKILINCCFSQNITKHKLTACLMYLCYFFLSL